MKTLEIPYYSQLDKGAEYYINDCLAACMRMVWGYYRLSLGKENPVNVTVNEFSKIIYESTADLGSILDVYKLPYPRAIPYVPVSKENGITIDRIKSEIENNHPVIALILYDKIRQIKSIGHFVVVVGYDENNLIIHDPYYKCSGNTSRELTCGAYRKVIQIDFDKAVNPGVNKYFSNSYQGLVWR